MNPNYTIKKSAWTSITLFRILFIWLIIPAILIIADIIKAKCDRIEFYDDKVIHKSGVLDKNEKQIVLTNIVSVSINQTFKGRLFNYGDINVNFLGNNSLSCLGRSVANPTKAKQYIEDLIPQNKPMIQIMSN